MARMIFPAACARLQNHFAPLGFEGVLSSPTSMTARVYDPQSGENLVVITCIPCGTTLSEDDVTIIAHAIEIELEVLEFRAQRAGDLSAG
jgi:hypothetical protein